MPPGFPQKYTQLWGHTLVGDVVDDDAVLPVGITVDSPLEEAIQFSLENVAQSGSDFSRVLYPNDPQFGAVEGSASDQTAAFQLWADAVTAQSVADDAGAVGVVPPGKWTVNGTVIWGDAKSGVSVFGYGAKIVSNAAAPIFSFKTIADQTDALNTIAARSNRTIAGIEFVGSNAAGSVGLQLEACARVRVRDCRFITCNVGLEGAFFLTSLVASCEFVNCASYGIYLTDGVGRWASASAANSASNVTVIDGCRVYNLAGASASYYIESSGGCVIRDCVAEGANPVHNVYYWGSTNTSALLFTIENLHVENTPTGAHVYVDTNARVNVGFGHVLEGPIWVDATDSGSSSVIHVTEAPYGGDTTAKFKDSGSTNWVFTSLGSNGAIDPYAETNWESGVRPDYDDIATIGYPIHDVYRVDSTTAYTPVLDDYGAILNCTNTAAVTVTLPLDATVPLPVGFDMTVFSTGTSGVTVEGAVGVTLAGTKYSINEDQAIYVRKLQANSWAVLGGTST